MNLGSQRQKDSEEAPLQHQGSDPHGDRDGQGGESAWLVLPSSSPPFLFCLFIWSLSPGPSHSLVTVMEKD